MSPSSHMSRNEFVKVVLGAVGGVMGAVLGLPLISYLLSPAVSALRSAGKEAWIPVGRLEDYPLGTPTLFSFTRTRVNGWERTTTSYGVYIYRKNGGEILALSNICTHLSCRVKWDETTKEYHCPCHDAQFTIEGQVAGGPPPRPLDAYPTKVEEGILYINFVEG